MRIAIIASKTNPITDGMMAALTGMGAAVRHICPEKQLTDLAKFRVEDDLYVLKSVDHLGLGLAGALDAAGANLLNSFKSVARIKHKVVITHILHSAGIPVPETYMATDPGAMLPLLENEMLIAKPFDGNRGRGIQIVCTPRELSEVEYGEFLMVQRYHKPDEPNRFIKAYFLDGRVFLTKRWWSPGGPNNKEFEPLEPSAVLTGLVGKCASALNLNLFGLDIVISQGNPYVVDIQEFGSFTGVPEAPILLAEFIYSYLRSTLSATSKPPVL